MTANEYVLELTDPRAIRLEVVGGKGASLARLASAGLPVPDGFHVTTGAYRRFVADNDLQPAILEAARAASLSQPSSLETASQAIARLFTRATVPSEIAEAIARAYADLPGEEPAVAVRSSATAEDLPELSFAGQHETYLNVRGIAAVQDAVKRCWASLWTPRAIGYRAQHGIDHGSVSLAVVVQMLVPAEASGVLFTANPVDGRRDRAVITATWGLGEAIVGGAVTPDTIVVEKASFRVIDRDTVDKRVMTVRTEGGTEERPTPAELRRAPVLTDEQAAELVRLGVQIEELYGMPMDIEWALSPSPSGRRARGEGFAILQARPITALPPEPAAPLEWRLPNPRGKYVRGSIIELLPEPLTPLFASLGLDEINRGYQRLAEAPIFTDVTGAFPEPFVVLINDYAYYDIAFSARQILRMMVKLPRPFKFMLSTAETRWRDQARPRYVETVARWKKQDLELLPARAAARCARDLLPGDRLLHIHGPGRDPAGRLPERVHLQLVLRKAGPEDRRPARPDVRAGFRQPADPGREVALRSGPVVPAAPGAGAPPIRCGFRPDRGLVGRSGRSSCGRSARGLV